MRSYAQCTDTEESLKAGEIWKRDLKDRALLLQDLPRQLGGGIHSLRDMLHVLQCDPTAEPRFFSGPPSIPEDDPT